MSVRIRPFPLMKYNQQITIILTYDCVLALPSDLPNVTSTVLIPTRSFNKEAVRQPLWLFVTSEDLETGSEDYELLKKRLLETNVFYNDIEWYMQRIQTVIKSFCANLENLVLK